MGLDLRPEEDEVVRMKGSYSLHYIIDHESAVLEKVQPMSPKFRSKGGRSGSIVCGKIVAMRVVLTPDNNELYSFSL